MFKDPIIKTSNIFNLFELLFWPGGVLKSEHFDLRDGAAASMFNPPQRRDQKEVGVKGLNVSDKFQQSFWRLQSFFLGGVHDVDIKY